MPRLFFTVDFLKEDLFGLRSGQTSYLLQLLLLFLPQLFHAIPGLLNLSFLP